MKPMTDHRSQASNEDEDGSDAEFEVTEDVKRCYWALKAAVTPQQRTMAMMALAQTFAKGHDFSDFTATDDWHSYIEEYEAAKLRFNQAGMRLGRLIANTLEAYLSEQPPDPRPRRSFN